MVLVACVVEKKVEKGWKNRGRFVTRVPIPYYIHINVRQRKCG